MDEHLVYLRSQLQIQLTGADAHIPFETSVADFPWDRAGEKLPNLDHTVWTLVWHIRACMDDVISYIRNEDYREPPFPRGYWPAADAPADEEEWKEALEGVMKGVIAFEGWISKGDLFAPLPANPKHTLYRQIRIIAQHNTYHIAQIVDLRQLLGIPVKDW